MKKKIVVIALIVAILALAAFGTFAFFTDTDEEDNVFTFGNVDIEIVESTLHRDNDAATDEEILANSGEDNELYQEYLAEQGKNMVPGRWVKKAPYIYNKGANDAYVRLTVVIPAAVDELTDIMLYTTGFNKGEMTIGQTTTDAEGNHVTTFTYTNPVKAGEVSYYAPFWQFKLKDTVDNEDLIAAGIDTPQEFTQSIKVYAEAIQSEGFDTAEAAFAAFEAQEG